jgi:hypothetical protein
VRVHKCLAFFLSELTKMENLKNFLLKIETKRMRIALIIQRLLMGAKKRRCMSMSKKRLLSIVVSAVILLSFACTAMAAEKSERYVGIVRSTDLFTKHTIRLMPRLELE